jgi:hypothetical protein
MAALEASQFFFFTFVDSYFILFPPPILLFYFGIGMALIHFIVLVSRMYGLTWPFGRRSVDLVLGFFLFLSRASSEVRRIWASSSTPPPLQCM